MKFPWDSTDNKNGHQDSIYFKSQTFGWEEQEFEDSNVSDLSWKHHMMTSVVNALGFFNFFMFFSPEEFHILS